MFDPTIGRWLSEDPIEFGGGDANLHRYVGNSPVSRTDPSGMDWRDWVYPLAPGPALAIELLGGEAPTPQAVVAGTIFTWTLTGPVGPAAATSFWYVVADKKFRAESMPLSATLLEHSLGPATPYVIAPTHFAFTTIRTNANLQAEVDKIVANAPIGNSSGTRSIEFTKPVSPDLYYAFHNADLQYSVSKKANDHYALEITVHDKYNFERNIQKIFDEELNLGWIGANAAWLTQFTGVIKQYDVSAGPFTFSKAGAIAAAIGNLAVVARGEVGK